MSSLFIYEVYLYASSSYLERKVDYNLLNKNFDAFTAELPLSRYLSLLLFNHELFNTLTFITR
jgi:hypothetical protein